MKARRIPLGYQKDCRSREADVVQEDKGVYLASDSHILPRRQKEARTRRSRIVMREPIMTAGMLQTSLRVSSWGRIATKKTGTAPDIRPIAYGHGMPMGQTTMKRLPNPCAELSTV